MKKTDNYSLPQWEKQDFIKMEDFNDLAQKTDAALKANADATATGLNAEIAARGEADAAEAENRSAALAALQASLAAAIGSGGKTCRIFTGSYTGTGRSGSVSNSSFRASSTLPRTNSLIWPLITSSFSCTIFSDIVCCLLSNVCVVTSFYQSLQAMSSFMLFSICATYCTVRRFRVAVW